MNGENIIVPFNILGFKAGDIVELVPFLARITAYMFEQDGKINALQTENDTLRDMNSELEQRNYELENENENILYERNEFYRPVNPYVYNGVSPSDF